MKILGSVSPRQPTMNPILLTIAKTRKIQRGRSRRPTSMSRFWLRQCMKLLIQRGQTSAETKHCQHAGYLLAKASIPNGLCRPEKARTPDAPTFAKKATSRGWACRRSPETRPSEQILQETMRTPSVHTIVPPASCRCERNPILKLTRPCVHVQ